MVLEFPKQILSTRIIRGNYSRTESLQDIVEPKKRKKTSLTEEYMVPLLNAESAKTLHV
jgi:hypothetical protein